MIEPKGLGGGWDVECKRENKIKNYSKYFA